MFDTRRTARNLFRGKRYYLSAVNGLLLYATVPLNELLRQTVPAKSLANNSLLTLPCVLKHLFTELSNTNKLFCLFNQQMEGKYNIQYLVIYRIWERNYCKTAENINLNRLFFLLEYNKTIKYYQKIM